MGLLHGDWYRYYDKYFIKCKYVNNKLEDTCFTFTNSNKLMRTIPYNNGVLMVLVMNMILPTIV